MILEKAIQGDTLGPRADHVGAQLLPPYCNVLGKCTDQAFLPLLVQSRNFEAGSSLSPQYEAGHSVNVY